MPKTKTVYRTAIYARLSRDDGDKAESNSIAISRSTAIWSWWRLL